MQNHTSANPDMVDVIVDRLHGLYLRVYDKLARKPQHVADVKAGKRPATFVKHRRDYWAMYQRGGDLDVVLEGIDELRADVESWRGIETIGTVIDAALVEAKAQGRADHLVLLAHATDDEDALANAYDAQARHTTASKQLTRSIGKRLAQKRSERRGARRFVGIATKGRAS